MTKKKASKGAPPAVVAQEKPLVEPEKKPPGTRKPQSEIGEIFSRRKMKRRDQEKEKKAPKDVVLKPKKMKKERSRSKDDRFEDNAPTPWKKTKDGLKVYDPKVLGIGRADAGDTMDVDKATRSVKPLYSTERRLRKVKQQSLAERFSERGDTSSKITGKHKAHQISAKSTGEAKQLSSAEPTAAKGGKFSRTNDSSMAEQVAVESKRKDKTNLANVTRSVKQLSLAERTVARAKQLSSAEPTAAKGGKFSRTNGSSRAQQVCGESGRKRSQVCLSMPDVPKFEKIKYPSRERMLACAVAEGSYSLYGCIVLF